MLGREQAHPENKKYVLINSEDVGIIDFDKVLQTSLSTLRYNNDKSQTFVKYNGNKPSFLGDRTEHNLEDFLELLSGDEWQSED